MATSYTLRSLTQSTKTGPANPRLLFALVMTVSVLAASTTPVDAAAVVGPEILFTDATLLSGGFGACPTYNATSCRMGIAAANARKRALQAQGIRTLMLPSLQRYAMVAKMHPYDWGMIFDLLPRLGIHHVISYAEFSTRHFKMSYRNHFKWRGLLDNFPFPMGHSMRRFFSGMILHEETRIQVFSARLFLTPIEEVATNLIDSMLGAHNLGDNFTVHTMILLYDTTPQKLLAAMKVANAALSKTVTLTPTVMVQFNGESETVRKIGNTYYVEFNAAVDQLHRVRLHEDPADKTKVINVTLEKESLVLPTSLIETPEYRTDQAILKVEHDKALGNDPYMGTIAGPMPAPITVAEGTTCMVRECAVGSLFADSIREKMGTDMAFFSGPWVIGGGWPQGNISLRNLYSAYPYTDQLAHGKFLGVTIYELFNDTLSQAGFNPRLPYSNVETHHLMQVSGVRVKYTFDRSRKERLVSIDVFNRTTTAYEPLKRLHMYTIACDAFLGRAGTIIRNYLRNGRYTGEEGVSLTSVDLQRSVGEFVRARNGAYVPGVDGRLSNVTGTPNLATMASWGHVRNGCSGNLALDKSIGTCVACAAGFQPSENGASCVPTPPPGPLLSSQALTLLLAGAALFLALISALFIRLFYVWRRYSRLRYCPRDGALPIAAFFVTVKNEVAFRERHPDAADAVLRKIERIVVDAAPDHQCYVAKKLKAHFLVISQDSDSAVSCAAVIFRTVENYPWQDFIPSHSDKTGSKSCDKPLNAPPAYHWKPQPQPRTQDESQLTQATLESIRSTPTPSPHSSLSSHSHDTSLRNVNLAAAILRSPRPRSVLSHASSPAQRRAFAASRSQASGASDCVHSGAGTWRTLTPTISIGIAMGHSRVEYDEDIDVFSYSGPVLDAAVIVADAAHGGQVLATEAVVNAAAKQCDRVVEFEEFCAKQMVCPLANNEIDVAMFQANVAGCDARTFESKSSDSDEAAGSLAAALEAAAGGLTARRVGVVAWTVPALRGGKSVFSSRADHLRSAEDVVAVLQQVCSRSAADIVSISDGVFTAVVNGSAARTAQVAVSTVDLAHAGMAALNNATNHRVACGACVGTSVTGAIASHIVVSGIIAERARLLATAAFNNVSRPAVLVDEETAPELEGWFALAAMDVIAWPSQCAAALSSKRTVAHPAAVVLYAVEDAMKADDDEWLYQLNTAIAENPHTVRSRQLLMALDRAPFEEQAENKHITDQHNPGGSARGHASPPLAPGFVTAATPDTPADARPTRVGGNERRALRSKSTTSSRGATPTGSPVLELRTPTGTPTVLPPIPDPICSSNSQIGSRPRIGAVIETIETKSEVEEHDEGDVYNVRKLLQRLLDAQKDQMLQQNTCVGQQGGGRNGGENGVRASSSPLDGCAFSTLPVPVSSMATEQAPAPQLQLSGALPPPPPATTGTTDAPSWTHIELFAQRRAIELCFSFLPQSSEL